MKENTKKKMITIENIKRVQKHKENPQMKKTIIVPEAMQMAIKEIEKDLTIIVIVDLIIQIQIMMNLMN